MAAFMGHGGVKNFRPFLPDAWGAGAWTGLLAAMVAAAWAYDVWSNVNLVGSEVLEPQRNIPLALIAGVSGVMLLYLLANAAYFWALPFAAVAHSQHVASDMIASFAGSRAAAWLTVAMVISALGTLNSSILSGARVPYAMGRDGLFFRFTGQVHPSFRTPGGALAFQAYLASVLALTGTFEDLFSLFIFAQWIFYGLVVASVYGLRRREPDLPRAYRTWGYPWTPAVFIAGAVALTVSLWAARPIRSTIGCTLRKPMSRGSVTTDRSAVFRLSRCPTGAVRRAAPRSSSRTAKRWRQFASVTEMAPVVSSSQSRKSSRSAAGIEANGFRVESDNFRMTFPRGQSNP